MPDNPYGVTCAINDATSLLHSQAILDAVSMGLGWIRLQRDANLIWVNQSDPTSAWSWNTLDDAVSRCKAAGLHVSFVLRAMPSWAFGPGNPNSAQTTTQPTYVADPAIAAQFAGAVAARYNGQQNCISTPSGGGSSINYGPLTLDAIECGNEEYNSIFVSGATRGLYNSPYSIYNGLTTVDSNHQPARDPHFYAPILKAESAAIRANHPQCRVGMCSLWWFYKENYTDFLQGMYDEGCLGKFDFANVHFYSNTWDPMTPSGGGVTIHTPGFVDMWTNLKNVLAANGDAGRQVWLTEIGWGTTTQGGGIDCDEPTQAARYQEVLDSARTSGVLTKLFFFTLSGYIKTASQVDTASLVQGGTSGWRYLQAFTTIKNNITSYPFWSLLYPKTLPMVASDGKLALVGSDGNLPLKEANP